MEKTVGITRARDELKAIVDNVQHQGDRYILSRHGLPVVAIVPVEIYENWKQQRLRLIEIMNSPLDIDQDLDPDEVMNDVLTAQQEVRRAARNRS